MPFKIVRNDITKVKADVIVNTANPNPICASGTDLAIYEAAGKEKLLAERANIGNLDRTLDEIRPGYHMDETCQRTVPKAIIAFLESKDFEDAIRNAVSLGGDTDTIGAITGSIAEAFYGIPAVLIAECRSRLDDGCS